ncbi:MAG: DUF308 domain-containing protein [Eubacteriales bacterium]
MKKNTIDVGGIVAGIFELLVGILLLIDPALFTNGIIIAAGVILCVAGIRFAVIYFRLNAVTAAKSRSLVKGLVCLLAGIFCIVRYRWFTATFPLLTVIYGVFILLFGLGKVQATVDMIRLKLNKWYLAAVSAVIAIACSVIILINPFKTTAVLWVFTGVALIVGAVLDIVVTFLGRGGNSGYDKEA